MGRRLHLLKRNDVFWWRRRLPRALLAHGAPAEFRRSLATTEPALARLRALRLSFIFEDVLLAHATKLRSKPLSRWQRDQVLGELYRKILEECDDWAAKRAPASKHLTPEDPEWHVDEYFRPGQLRSWWTTLFQCGEYDEAADRLKPLLASHRIELDPESPEFRSLAADGMRHAIAAFAEAEETLEAGRLDDAALARLRRNHAGAAGPGPANAQSAQDMPPRQQHHDRRLPSPDWPLREIYELFVADKRGISWKAEAEDDAWKALELFEELVGLRKIGEIDHGDAYAFRAQIQRLPKYHGKGRYTGLGPARAIDLAGEIEAELKENLARALAAGEITEEEHDEKLAAGLVPRCGPKTVNKHLDYIGGCLKWANKRFGWQLKNPFADNRFSKRELRKTGKARRAMKDAELKELFETALFTGCHSEDRRSRRGNLVLKDSFYWLPLITVYTGARLEEICQLTVADIIEVDDTWCIKISAEEDDQEVKTEAALRLIPLHPALLKLGLVDRVLKLRAAGKRRLFPDLTAGGRYGRYGYRLTKRWTHYRRQVGLYAPGKDFHTLRHSFNTHLLNKNVPVVWMSQIMGHATSTQTAGYAVNYETSSTYYGGAEIAALAGAVAQFDFGLKLMEVGGEWQITR
ncbi:MAG: hypothetical protein Kow00114_25610 [Kiloniellaceae bacterium]